MKGKQLQVSLYLPPEQYWLLRATSQRTGFSMQYLLRRALDTVLRDARQYPLPASLIPAAYRRRTVK
jgi:hypothetical protein